MSEQRGIARDVTDQPIMRLMGHGIRGGAWPVMRSPVSCSMQRELNLPLRAAYPCVTY